MDRDEEVKSVSLESFANLERSGASSVFAEILARNYSGKQTKSRLLGVCSRVSLFDETIFNLPAIFSD